jgi:hypothetical protein
MISFLIWIVASVPAPMPVSGFHLGFPSKSRTAVASAGILYV